MDLLAINPLGLILPKTSGVCVLSRTLPIFDNCCAFYLAFSVPERSMDFGVLTNMISALHWTDREKKSNSIFFVWYLVIDLT